MDTYGKVQMESFSLNTVLIDIAGHRHPVSVSFSPLTDGN
jgi:hypothetical protein